MAEIHRHLNSRYLNTDLHNVWVEPDYAMFPLWDLSGNITGLHQYRPNADKDIHNAWEGKYFTRVHRPGVTVWGLESWNLSNTLFVCEGLFDAAKVTYAGYSAIAILSNDPGLSTRSWLYTVRNFRPIVALCDNDSPGFELAKFGHKFFQCSDYHDIGDTPIEEVNLICQQFN